MVHNLHSKAKGVLGEIAVAKDLLRQGYQVFSELGDNSKVDLIVMDDVYHPYKIQVKAFQSTKGSVILPATKSGPGYHFRYEGHHIDVFALYILDRDLIAYIAANELLAQRKSLTFRIDTPLNNQQQGIRWLSDYSEFRKALRGHTQRTLTDHAEGEEMVQTTTEQIVLASES